MDSDSDDESYIEEAERKAKQNYLNEEILENNYDPELFMRFCSFKKEPNIDHWSFEELQELVHEFRMKYRRGQTLKEVLEAEAKSNPQKAPKKVPSTEVLVTEVQIKAEEPKKSEEKIIIQTKSSENPLSSSSKNEFKTEIPRQVSKVEEKAQFNTEIKNNPPENRVTLSKPFEVPLSKDSSFIIICKKLEKNELSEAQNLEFIIKTPEHVEGKFLSKDYYLYPVFTSPLNWECKRRYSDYIWFRETLFNLLPGHFIPPIPPHKSITNAEEDIVFKRKAIIAKFTSAIARNRTFLLLPVVEQFFKIPSSEDFGNYKKKLKNSCKRIENPENFFSITGSIECTVADLSLKANAFTEYATSAESIEKKLKRQVTTVLKDMKTMAETFSGISNLIHQLEDLQDMIPVKSNAKNYFSKVHNSFESLHKIEVNRHKSLKEHFNMYFKYSYLEKEKMKELLRERESAYSEFEKAEIKKNKNLPKLRTMYGFYNVSVLREIERVIQEENTMLNKNFFMFARRGADLTSESHTIWSKLIESLEQI